MRTKLWKMLVTFLVSIWCQFSFAEENAVITKSVFENTSPGYLIGNMANDMKFAENDTTDNKTGMQFEYNKNFSDSIYFVLNSTTGDLRTSNISIDRESDECRFSDNCMISFGVTAKRASFFRVVTVIIMILDVNDNAPKFDKYLNGSTELDISEKDLAGTIYGPWRASDIDQRGNNTIQKHFLEQPAEIFTLSVTNNSDGYTFSYILALKHYLDREVTDHYQIKIIAQDGGNPTLNGTLVINVRILDANDNCPIFLQSYYQATINENITQNTVLLTVHAFDLDIGKNAEISYKIRQIQSNFETINRLLSVNETSGEISAKTGFISESAEQYEFVVVAEDHGDPALANETIVKIIVNDVMNNPPSIELNLFSPSNTNIVVVQENSDARNVVAYVIVKDSDKGANGQFTCLLSTDLYALKVSEGGYTIVVNGLLDREVEPVNNVTVTCLDNGTPPMSSSRRFEVILADVNDNDPVFSNNVYDVEIAENNAVNATIVQVTATDIDFGENADVEYILIDDNRNLFFINNNYGLIYASQSFDRERDPTIVFRVVAADHGAPRRSATTTISLTLTDVNDNAPVMIPNRPVFHFLENLDSNTLVGILSAKDDDIGINSMFSFTLVSNNFPFTISPDGEIRNSEMLNREQQAIYTILVTVIDKGAVPLNNTHYVTIYIDDVNDNSPMVTFPNANNNTVTCWYPVGDYNVVTTISAYDLDFNGNGTLTFSIVAGNDLDVFDIDPDLGEVYISRYSDLRGWSKFALTVQVSDKAIVPMRTNVTLNIEIQFRNATSAAVTGDETRSKYVVITVVVILITASVAVVIIAIIMFLRSVDKKRHDEVCARYSEAGFSSNGGDTPNQNISENEEKSKGKKVSFSGLDGDKNVKSNSDDNALCMRYYDAVPKPVRHDPLNLPIHTSNQEQIDNHTKARTLQQHLWEAKSPDWALQLIDSGSETSRDTITCDSGRGGSEDDMSTASPAADESQSFGVLEHKGKLASFRPQNATPVVNMVSFRKEDTQIQQGALPCPPTQDGAPQRPTIYKRSIPNIQTNPHVKSRLAIKNLSNMSHRTMNNFQTNQTPFSVYYIDTCKDYVLLQNDGLKARIHNESENLYHSNEDDGGSTTTSGSYTLDQNDIDIMRGYPIQRDMLV